MNPTANIPVIEFNRRILTQSYAILRHFARQLGKYDVETEEEKYWADAMCDIVIDCKSPALYPGLKGEVLKNDSTYSLHRRLLLPLHERDVP